MYYNKVIAKFINASELSTFFKNHVQLAGFTVQMVSSVVDPITISSVHQRAGRLHVSFGFIDNASTIDISYRAFVYVDVDKETIEDNDRLNSNLLVPPNYTFGLDADTNYDITISGDGILFFTMVFHRVGQESRIIHFSHGDVTPQFFQMKSESSLTAGTNSLTLPISFQRPFWNYNRIDSRSALRHSLMVVEEGGVGNSEMVTVEDINGSQLTITPLVYSYEGYRIGDSPIRTVVYVNAGASTPNPAFPLTWYSKSGWQALTKLQFVNPGSLTEAKSAPQPDVGLHGVSKLAGMGTDLTKTIPEFTLHGILLAHPASIAIGESIFILDDEEDYTFEWAAAGKLGSDYLILLRKT